MPESEILVTMAEVAAAFAGFTALASVFSGQRTRDHPRVSALILRVMIEAALLVVFFSLLPLILERMPLPLPRVWQVCSAAFVVAWLGFVGGFLRSVRRVRHDTGVASTPWYVVSVLLSLVLGNSILLLVAFGAIDSWAGGAYSLGLFFALLNSAFSFARFFFGAYGQAGNESAA